MIWMKALELFAGAGGAALGLEAAGFEHLACVEVEGDAASTLALSGLPAVHGDVRDLDHYIGMMPGLLWSSFPCQAWSTAGRRKGAEDERGGDMWKATVEVIDFTEPIWFIGENVVGLTQHRGECDDGCAGPQRCPAAYLDRVILDDLRSRFAWAGTRILNASDYGVPQHRRRLIIVAGPAPIDWPEPTHGKPTAQADLFGRQLEPWVTVRQALGLDGELGGMRNTEANPRQERPAPTDEPSPTVGGKGNAMYSSRVIAEPSLVERQSGKRGHTKRSLDEPSPTVLAPGQGGFDRLSIAGGADRASDALWLATGRRRLTVEECAALQGFPAGHPFSGTKTSQYRQVGNAVPPRLAEVVARAVTNKQEELEEE